MHKSILRMFYLGEYQHSFYYNRFSKTCNYRMFTIPLFKVRLILCIIPEPAQRQTLFIFSRKSAHYKRMSLII